MTDQRVGDGARHARDLLCLWSQLIFISGLRLGLRSKVLAGQTKGSF